MVIADEFWGGISGLIPGALIVAVGGLITGLLQLRTMRRHSARSGWWILASIVGWGLSWLAMDLGFGVGLLTGGALLGVVTGGAIVWLLHNPPSTEQDAGEALSTSDAASST